MHRAVKPRPTNSIPKPGRQAKRKRDGAEGGAEQPEEASPNKRSRSNAESKVEIFRRQEPLQTGGTDDEPLLFDLDEPAPTPTSGSAQPPHESPDQNLTSSSPINTPSNSTLKKGSAEDPFSPAVNFEHANPISTRRAWPNESHSRFESKAEKQQRNRERRQWVCPSCERVNHDDARQCFTCRARRSYVKTRVDLQRLEWICSTCERFNFGARCIDCDSQSPKDPAIYGIRGAPPSRQSDIRQGDFHRRSPGMADQPRTGSRERDLDLNRRRGEMPDSDRRHRRSRSPHRKSDTVLIPQRHSHSPRESNSVASTQRNQEVYEHRATTEVPRPLNSPPPTLAVSLPLETQPQVPDPLPSDMDISMVANFGDDDVSLDVLNAQFHTNSNAPSKPSPVPNSTAIPTLPSNPLPSTGDLIDSGEHAFKVFEQLRSLLNNDTTRLVIANLRNLKPFVDGISSKAEVDQLRQQNEHARQEIASLKEQVTIANRKFQDSEKSKLEDKTQYDAKLTESDRGTRELRNKLQDAEMRVVESNRAVAKLQAQLDESTKKEQGVEQERATKVIAREADLEKQVEAFRSKLTSVEGKLADKEAVAKSLEKKAADAEANASLLSQQLNEVRMSLADRELKNADLAKKIEALEKEASETGAELESSLKDNVELNASNEKSQVDLKAAKEEVVALQSKMDDLNKLFVAQMSFMSQYQKLAGK